MSKASTKSAHIREETSPYRRGPDYTPGPGHHDGHLTAFGSDVTRNIGMGSKYEFKPDTNPAPGQYNIEQGHNMSKSQSKSVIIREETSPYRRPKENSPGPGEHDGHLISIGQSIKTNIGMGSKYVFKPDKNPAPGQYEPGHSQTKAKSKGGYIKPKKSFARFWPDEENGGAGFRVADSGPAPGSYQNPYLDTPKIKPDVYVNSKHKEKRQEGPSATQYSPNDKFLSNRKRSPDALIKESVMQLYDMDVPPYNYSPSKSTKAKGLSTAQSERSIKSKVSKKSKTPKQTSLKELNAQNMNKYL